MPAGFVLQSGMPRAVRGTALATVNAVLAVVAHVTGGGTAPDGALTVLATIGIAAAGTALADRQRGPLAMLAAVVVIQVLLHLLLDGLSGHQDPIPLGSAGTMMTAAHAAAALLTVMLLTGAESALFSVAAALRGIVGRLPLRQPPARQAAPPTAPPLVTPAPVALRRLFFRVTPHRGPPPAA
jgi:hypothetical protein